MLKERTEQRPLPEFEEVASAATRRWDRLQGLLLLALWTSMALICLGFFLRSWLVSQVGGIGLIAAGLGNYWVGPRIREAFRVDAKAAGLSPAEEDEIWYKAMEE